MSTVIICIILVVICVFAVINYSKKLKNGCCGNGGDSVKKIKASDKNKDNYSYVKIAGVSGMTCKNCKIRVENAFNKNDGMLAVVDLGKEEAIIYSKEYIADDVVFEIIRNAGYGCGKIKDIAVEK